MRGIDLPGGCPHSGATESKGFSSAFEEEQEEQIESLATIGDKSSVGGTPASLS